jgi:cytochrome c oxidase cbb3-type subunit 3
MCCPLPAIICSDSEPTPNFVAFHTASTKESSMQIRTICVLFFSCAIALQAQTRPGPGPANKQTVDAVAADRGKTTYLAECITCHGPKARGNESGPDLIRSLVVLADRYGTQLGPFLRNGHPRQSAASAASFTQTQIQDLSHFLKLQFNETLRSSPNFRVQNVLTGDARAGSAYFNGEGKCNTCHSASGDLASLGKKYDPPTLQQRFLFPQRTKPTTITVTSRSGPPVSGTLVRIDDFNVSLRDASGDYRSWKRTPELKIERSDPYAGHIDVLDKITDKNMHDVVAYLESLK